MAILGPLRRFSELSREFLFAIFILLGLVVLTTSLVFVQVIVPGHMLTNSFKLWYNILTTLSTTVLASYATFELQKQWLRDINHESFKLQYRFAENPGIAPKWRTVLGIETFSERIKSIRSTGLAQLSFFATGLITTVVVTAVTLQETTCSALIPAPRIHSGADSTCARSVPDASKLPRLSPLSEYRTTWNKSDGSDYLTTTSLGCPSWSGAKFIGSINAVNPHTFAYAREGVAIAGSAIGAPEIFYTNTTLPPEPQDLYGHRVAQSSIRSVAQCLPIMASNPVVCKPGGKVTASDLNSTFHQLLVDAGGCSQLQTNFEDSHSPFGAMSSRLCTSSGTVGQASTAIGATNIMALTLAASIGDMAFLDANGGKYETLLNGSLSGLSYALSCTVDVAPTIRWRNLTYVLDDPSLAASAEYSKKVSGADDCTTTDVSAHGSAWSLGDGYAGGAIAALIPLLAEGHYWNGMINTILNQALNVTKTSDRYSTASAWKGLVRTQNDGFGFTQSKNALEDVLGITMGITMSQMSTLNSQSPGSPLTEDKHFFPPVNGSVTFTCTRVGPGQLYALLFAVPPLVAFLIACFLLAKVPTGRTLYKLSRLEDIVAIGKMSAPRASSRSSSKAPLWFDRRRESSSARSSLGNVQGLDAVRLETRRGRKESYAPEDASLLV